MSDPPARFNADHTLASTELAYVVREFESEMFDHLTGHSWVSLLGPHKYGKSSALVRLRDTLARSEIASAFVDMQRYSAPSDDYGMFLEWFADAVASDIGPTPVPPKSRRQRRLLEPWLLAAVDESHANVIVLIDEASGVPRDMRHNFFSQLRAFFGARNTRPHTPEGRLSNRMNFVFAGTFRPSQIIEGPNSPFNIAEEVNPDDFTLAQVRELARSGLDTDAEYYADRAFAETGGQPYYVQDLFAAVQKAGSNPAAGRRAFDQVLHELQAGVRGYVEDLIRMVARDHELRSLAPAIASGRVPFGGPLHQVAATCGVARERDGYLVARNPIVAAALARYLHDGGVRSGEYPS